jgi:predicted transcriptional regulator
LRETLRVYETLGLGAETLDPPERFLQRLPSTFSTGEAKEAADAEHVARRTLFKWLKDLQSDGLLEKVQRGQYRTTAAAVQ